MDSKVNYTIVGLFVLLLGAALIIIIFWLSTLTDHQKYNTYLVYMHDSVEGLSEQSPVLFNGVRVGYVEDIELNRHDPQTVRIQLEIVQGTPISTATYATLLAQGITGLNYVGLKTTSPDAPPLKTATGEKYPIIPSRPSLLVQLGTALQEVTKNIQKLSDSFQKVLNKENQQSLQESLANIAKVTDVLAKNSANLDESIKSSTKLVNNLSAASNQFPKLVTQFDHTLAAVQSMSNNISGASKSVRNTMQSGDHTITQVQQQILPETQVLINKINQLTTQLQGLTSEIKRNPAVIIRGKTPPAPGPGEDP